MGVIKQVCVLVVLIVILVAFLCLYLSERHRRIVQVNPEIANWLTPATATSAETKPDCVKILWMYWEQGIENLHEYHQGAYNRMCFDGWRTLNPDWDIRVLDKATASEYVPQLSEFDHLSRPMRSDLLRIKLLEKYGGVWADASTLPMRPLTGWVEHCDDDAGIFFYRYFPTRLNRLLNPFRCVHYISSWFIVAKQPNHYLIRRLSEEFERRVARQNRYTRHYFCFHETLTHLINTDELIKTYMSLLTTSQDLSHSILRGKPHAPLDKSHAADHPLCYKRAVAIDHQQYYDYINSF